MLNVLFIMVNLKYCLFLEKPIRFIYILSRRFTKLLQNVTIKWWN